MKPLINLISRVFLALALCVSAPAAFAGDSSYDIDKERVAQEIREKAMSGDLDGASEAVETYEDSPLAAAKLLIATGGDVNAKNQWGNTLLHEAAWKNEYRATQLLLENGAKIVANDVGSTPLHYAAFLHAAEVAKVLLDYGADIEARTGDGWLSFFHYGDATPLLVAFYTRVNFHFPHDDEAFVEVVKLLIANGADVNAKAENGIMAGYASGILAGYMPMDMAGIINIDAIHEALIAAGARCNKLKSYADYISTTPARYRRLIGSYQAYAESCGEPVAPPPEPKADYTGLYANAAFAVAGAFAPSWVDTQTFAFNEGDKLVTGQSLSVPLDDFTFAAKRVQVNDLTDYEFAVKWEMEF